MIKIRESVLSLLEEITLCRRSIHQNPEVGLETKETKQFIISKLKEYGIKEIEERFLENSVVACLRVNDSSSYIGFRADMDALAMQEGTSLSFKSKNDGATHACGHDGHMAILLGLIKYLNEHREQVKENIVFVFQPGEEGPGGAKRMIDAGLFKQYPMRYIFATHLMADVEAGKVACKSGPLLARNGEIIIHVYGHSAHGAAPHLGKDAIIGASSLLMQLQTIVSRNINPLKGVVISIGKMHGGEVSNVICDHVEMNGTMRSFDDESYDVMKKRMNELAHSIASMHDLKIDLEIIDYYDVVDNDVFLDATLKEVMNEDYCVQEPKMISEDFSFYQKETPGLFYFTGVLDEEHTKGIHDSQFNFNEASLLNSVETNLRLLEKLGAYYD